ncbi:MAG: hypothetical protein AB1634_16335 [Thermodesulfobacteriota bacterium]
MKILRTILCATVILILAAAAAVAAEPGAVVVDIKANGSDTGIVVEQGTDLTVTIALDAGDQGGQRADWLIAFQSPRGWLSWRGVWTGGRIRTFTLPLASFPAAAILDSSQLPAGHYTFYFGIDPVGDQSFDPATAVIDQVAVTISSPFDGTYAGTAVSETPYCTGATITATVQGHSITGQAVTPPGTYTISGTVDAEGHLTAGGRGTGAPGRLVIVGDLTVGGGSGRWGNTLGCSGTWTALRQ